MVRRPIPSGLILTFIAYGGLLLLFTLFALSGHARVRVSTPRNKTAKVEVPPHTEMHPSLASPKAKRRRLSGSVGVEPEAVKVHDVIRLPQIDGVRGASLTPEEQELVADGDAFFSKISIQCPTGAARYSYDEAKKMCRDAPPSTSLIIIHRYLLNITRFDHPGGPRTIEAAIGKGNSIELFMQHHRAFVGEQFSKLCVGIVTY